MSQADRVTPTQCPVCAARGENGNVLREGDSVFVHTGNHQVVHRYVRDIWLLECPGPEAERVAS